MKRLPLLMLTVLACACTAPAPPPSPDTPAPPSSPTPETAAPPLANAPAETQAGQVPRVFLCRGNEPFWALDVQPGAALLRTPEAEIELLGEVKASPGGSFAFRGAPDGSPEDEVSALIAPGQCFDSMADGPAMPFTAQVRLPGDQPGNGCCRAEYGLDLGQAALAVASEKPAGDWSRLLPELSDAVQRCVRDAGVDAEAVVNAWPMNRGQAGVRLRDTGGDRFDCVVDLETGAIDDVRPVAADDTQPGEGQPVWIPDRDSPPVLTCGRVERVPADEDGGILHYRDGCD